MAQTPEGALKVAAKKAGISLAEFQKLTESGLKKCTKCREWQPVDRFSKDASRYDGKAAQCVSCRRVSERICTKGRASAFLGKTHSDAAKARMSNARKGKQSPSKGTVLSIEVRAKISQSVRLVAHRGENAPGYVDGRGYERRGFRLTKEVKQWAYDVKLRDEFCCVMCGDDRGGNLEAHHIRPFAEFPELRTETRNGVTLCKPCHITVHQFGLQLWSPCQ